MRGWRLRRDAIWAGAAAVVAIALGLVGNLVANQLPQAISHGAGLWVAFGVLVAAAIVSAVLVRADRSAADARVRKRLLDRAAAVSRSLTPATDVLEALEEMPGSARMLGERDKVRFRASAEHVVVSLKSLPKQLLRKGQDVAVITGEPGSGKTWLLRRCLDRSVRNARKDASAPLPVWLDLHDWPVGRSLEAWLRRVIVAMGVPEDNVDALLTQQVFVLFLDGLDQIPVRSLREEAYASILGFTRSYGLCQVFVTCQTETYERLAPDENRIPRIEILPLTEAGVIAVLEALDSAGRGILAAARLAPDLLRTLETPLYLRAAARAFHGRSAEQVLGARAGGTWESTIVERYVDVVLDERGNEEFLAGAVFRRFLSWMAAVFAEAHVSSFYGFLPPRHLRDPALRELRLNPLVSAAYAVVTAIPFGVAAYLLVGPRSAAVLFVAALVGVVLLGRYVLGKLDLEIQDEQRRWSAAAVRDSLPGLAARVLAGLVVLIVAAYLVAQVTSRARSLGAMTDAQVGQARAIMTVFLALLLVSYLAGFLHDRGTDVVERPFESDFDVRPASRRGAGARLSDWLDLEMPLMVGGAALVAAGLWSAAFTAFSTLAGAHLRIASVESAFHGLLQFMAFPRRAPLTADVGIAWSLLVGAVAFAATWVAQTVGLLWTGRALNVWGRAAQLDSGLGDVDMLDALEYGRHLTLLRRTEGRYSFSHERYEAYFAGTPGPTS